MLNEAEIRLIYIDASFCLLCFSVFPSDSVVSTINFMNKEYPCLEKFGTRNGWKKKLSQLYRQMVQNLSILE